jgi:hypothetical protein
MPLSILSRRLSLYLPASNRCTSQDYPNSNPIH